MIELLIVVFIILLVLSGFFSSSETSLFSLTPRQLEQMRFDENPRVGLIEQMLNQPRLLIVTILIGNELVNVAASVTSAALVIRLMGAGSTWVNLVVMIPILLVFGEITPKTLAIRHNVAFATFQSRPITRFSWLITPIREVVRFVADQFITLIVGKERSRGNILTEDMVQTLADEAVGEGALDAHEAAYIERIFRFQHQTAMDVMTPRSHLVCLPITTPMDEVLEVLRRTKHTRIPIYDGRRDHVVGVLYVRDLLGLDLDELDRNRMRFRQLLRKPYIVPDTRSAPELFHSLRDRNRSHALLVDEYGGLTGFVTTEDLLESIFGDIVSPSEAAKKVRFERLGPTTFRVSGSMPVVYFNRRTGAELDERKSNTLGGLVLGAFGEMPIEGTEIEIGGFRFTIRAVRQNRIATLDIEGAVLSDTQDPTPPPTEGA